MKLAGSDEYISGGIVPASNYKPNSMGWKDVYLGRYKWYRKLTKKIWYQHEFTPDALDLSVSLVGTFWALYGEINRYSKVIETENYKK